MQVETTARVLPSVSVASVIDDRDHLFGTAPAVTLRADIPLSVAELVAALFCMSAGTTLDELAEMSDEDVRRDVAHTLTFVGLMTVQQEAQCQLTGPQSDPEAREFLALCQRRIGAAFGVTASTPARPRAAARSIGWRRTVARTVAA